MPVEDREAESWIIVSDADTDNSDDYLGANSDQEKLQTLLKQRITQLQRKARRDYAKQVAGRNFLLAGTHKGHWHIEYLPGYW